MKNFRVTILTLVMALLFTSTSFAIDNDLQTKQYSKEINTMSLQELNTFKKEIYELNDKQFNQFIVKYLKNNTDYEQVKKELAKLDVEITVPKLTTNSISPMYTEAYNANLWVTSAKRGGESFYRLIAYYGFDKGYAEWNPATYDVIGVYWNKNAASFYSYENSSDEHNSLKSAQNKSEGLLLFNAYDSKMASGVDFYVAAYVTKKNNTNIDFGADWTHTYSTKSTSSSGSAKVDFGGNGIVGGSIGYTVTTSTNESSWQISDVNTIIVK
ncbi:hypothetical protein J2Z32_003149 [Paenibacillus turicensis]|uniref:Uncharacterized protein n=1 Tax=Paenibacillus turicensis TaxID=160487 RepID=A0ABS4FV81_9BACL|nr:hypothetical protein [Paenibacillus turicensis]MBP1906487.1 hypothetical protein [Paenibacillus turicensis]